MTAVSDLTSEDKAEIEATIEHIIERHDQAKLKISVECKNEDHSACPDLDYGYCQCEHHEGNST